MLWAEYVGARRTFIQDQLRNFRIKDSKVGTPVGIK